MRVATPLMATMAVLMALLAVIPGSVADKCKSRSGGYQQLIRTGYTVDGVVFSTVRDKDMNPIVGPVSDEPNVLLFLAFMFSCFWHLFNRAVLFL